MEEIVIARLSPADMLRLRLRLGELNLASSLDGLYWLPVPRDLLDDMRRQHLESCGPYILALDTDTGNGELRLEPLARAQNHMHCECIAPASAEVVEYGVEYVQGLLRGLSITSLNRWKDCQA